MQKYFKQILIALVAASVYFLPGLFESHGGLAQVESPLPEPNSMVVWYANTFKLSYKEAERRLNLQSEMGLRPRGRNVVDHKPRHARKMLILWVITIIKMFSGRKQPAPSISAP